MKSDKLNKQNHFNCDFPIELLSAYIDNELNEIDKQKVEEQIRHCSHCLKIIEELKAIDMGLKEIEIEEPSREFIFNLKKNVMEKIRKKPSPVFWKFVPVLVPVAAVVALVIIITGHENLASPVSMKNRIDIIYVPSEKSVQTDKIEVVLPKPGIVAKRQTPAPAASGVPVERKFAEKKDLEVAYKKTEAPASEVEEVARERIAPVVVRAVIDSTGRVLNVATGNTITPEEDTTLSRILKGQHIAPPTVRGKPTQMVVEFVADEKDTNDIK